MSRRRRRHIRLLYQIIILSYARRSNTMKKNMPADNDPMSKIDNVEEGLADDFIGAVKGVRDPWWKRKRIICPLIISFVVAGVLAIAVGATLSSNSQREGGDSAVSSLTPDVSSPTPDSYQSSSPSLAPHPTSSAASSSSSSKPKHPTQAPSTEGSYGSSASSAINHMWKTTAPTGLIARQPLRPTVSPSPTERPTTSAAPTTARPSPSPTVSFAPTENCYWVEVDIVYDSFPTETSWTIENDMGDVMKSYQEEDWVAMFYSESICLQEGTYQFAILDEHGDGMLAPGYYSLTSYGEYIDQGAGFGHTSTSTFSLPWTPVPHEELYEYHGAESSEEENPEHPDFILDLMMDVFEYEEGIGVRD